MNVRKVALECLLTLSHTTASVASVVDSAFERYAIGGRERRLVNALVYGVVRWRRQLDWVLNQFINPRFQLDARHRNILRLGAFQLLHLDGIPAHAAIYETVQLATSHLRPSAKGRKTTGFINAVLRSVQREGATLDYPPFEENPAKRIAISLSYPTWLVKRWLQTRGIAWTLAFCRASNQIRTTRAPRKFPPDTTPRSLSILRNERHCRNGLQNRPRWLGTRKSCHHCF